MDWYFHVIDIVVTLTSSKIILSPRLVPRIKLDWTTYQVHMILQMCHFQFLIFGRKKTVELMTFDSSIVPILLFKLAVQLTPFRKIILNWFRTPVGKKMPEMQLGSHTLRSHGVKMPKVHQYDSLILLLLAAVDLTLNLIEPFHRFVGKEMMTDLKYRFQKDTIPFWAVPVCISFSPALFFLSYIEY